jgi:hypothetical protein
MHNPSLEALTTEDPARIIESMSFWIAYKYGKAKAAAHAANMEIEAMAEANQAALLADAQGARWRRNPDGSWMRWSYLGEDWEKAEPPAMLLQAVELKPAENYWIAPPQGGWMPYDPSKPAEPPKVEEHNSEQLPPAQHMPPQQERSDPDSVPKPEWTSDWQPGWKQEFK